MELESSEHILRIFSNQSTEFYENKISNFTSRLAKPIALSASKEWFIALTNLYLPPTIFHSEVDIIFNDNVLIPDIDPKQVFGNSLCSSDELGKFFSELLEISPSAYQLYNESYFEWFLNENHHFDQFNLKRTFVHDVLPLINTNQLFTVNLQISDLIEKDEKLDEFIFKANALRLNPNNVQSIAIRFDKSFPYTIKQILFTIINQVLYATRLSIRPDDNEVRQKYYREIFEKKKDFQKTIKEHKKLNNKSDQLIHRILKKFINSFKENLFKQHEQYKFYKNLNSHFVFIYLNILQETFVSDKLYKVLAIFPDAQIHTHEKFKNLKIHSPVYLKIETDKIYEINVQIKNEFSFPVPFSHSATPAYLELHIISKNRE